MQNFTMVMPGETQGCVGCHETRTGTPSSRISSGALMAINRQPSQIEPYAGVPDVLDYPRDIQPIWDRHCVTCHSSEKPLGHVVLTGDNNEWFSQSYSAILAAALLIGLTGQRRTGPVAWGVAALYLTQPLFATWGALARPDNLAVLFSALGVIVVDRCAGRRGVLWAVPLFLLAGLTKQSIFAGLLASVFYRSRQRVAPPVTTDYDLPQ